MGLDIFDVQFSGHKFAQKMPFILGGGVETKKKLAKSSRKKDSASFQPLTHFN